MRAISESTAGHRSACRRRQNKRLDDQGATAAGAAGLIERSERLLLAALVRKRQAADVEQQRPRRAR